MRVGEHAVGGEHVLTAIAIGHVVAGVADRRGLDLLVGHGREAELVEDRLDRPGGALANGKHGVLAGGLDARVHLPVALQGHPLVEIVGVVVAAAERVVVARHDAVARGDEVSAGEELSHQLGSAARGGVRGDRVVARGDLEVEPGRDQVLCQDRPRASGQAHRQGDARDGAVLHALRSARAHEAETARLEREHRAALAVPHQRFRPRAGREPHLDAAAGVGRGEERLRPRRVVAVVECRVGAVDRERLGVGHETLDRKPQVEALLDCALRHHPGAPGLRANQQRHGVERRIARHAHRRLALREAAQARLSGVRREQGGAFLEVRHVRLVGGRPPGPQALEREHHLDGVELPDHPRQLGGCEAARQPHELGAGHVHVDEHPRELQILEPHGLGRDRQIDAVGRDEAIERVEALARRAVELADDAAGDHERRHPIARAVHRHEAERGIRPDQRLPPERRRGAHPEALAARLVAHAGVLSSPRSAITSAASRTKAAQRGAATAASCCAIASSSAAVARRGRRAV